MKVFLPTITAVLLIASSASAQSRGYVAFKAGLNAEHAEDDVHGTTGAGGVTLGFHLSAVWALEGEFWYPGAIKTNPAGGRHHDTLFGASVRRSFGDRIRPHVMFGISAARTEDEFTTCIAHRTPFGSPSASTQPTIVSCDEPDIIAREQERFSSMSLVPLAGIGVEIPLTSRLVLIPDLRVQIGIGSVIVRPAIAFAFTF